MKANGFIRIVPALAGTVILGAALVVAARAQFGGFGRATGTPGLGAPAQDLNIPGGQGLPLNDLELTAATKMDEAIEKQLSAAEAARTEVQNLSFKLPPDPNAIAAAVEKLGQAEQALALARADQWTKIKSEFDFSSPETMSAFIAAVQNPGSGRGGFGGGRGGRGGGRGAAAGRGGAAGAAGGAAGRAGN